MHRFLKTFF